jgi:DNA-binding response OmpR family regulator
MNTFIEPPCDKAACAPIQGQTNPPNRILFVDDNIAVREASAKVLIRSGYQVDAAEDGEAGWKALHASSYDLLITDHNMPKLSGVELIKKLRSASMKLPVVLASGALPTEELNQNPWLQFAATLLKPFTVEELLDAVKAALSTTAMTGSAQNLTSPVLAEAVIPVESLPNGEDSRHRVWQMNGEECGDTYARIP